MGLGLLMCLELYALLGAIQFIPVALAILTLYLYPLFIACVEHLLGRTRIGLVRGAAMLVTFLGLFLVFNAPLESPDWRPVWPWRSVQHLVSPPWSGVVSTY